MGINLGLNATWTKETKYMVARSSKIKESNHLYNLIDTVNAVEQGCNVKIGTKVKGEMDVYNAETPAIGDKIVFVCDVPLNYASYTTADQYEYKFINRAGKEFRCYELGEDDIVGVSDYGITLISSENGAQEGNLIVVDGNRKWKELAKGTDVSTYGFVGEVVGFEKYQFDTVVLFKVIKNKTVA